MGIPENIIVTGASSGVGKATAKRLASQGATVFLIARRQDQLDEVASEITKAGGKAIPYAADLSDYTQVQAAFSAAEDQLKDIHALVNAAGVPGNSVFNTPEEELKQIIAVNLVATMYCAKEAATRMRPGRKGHIINIGSLCVRVLDNGADIYVASKTGVAGFTASLRKELAPDNIAVTLINPGQIASGMVSENETEKQAAIEAYEMLKPDDVAEAIFYVLSQTERVVVTEVEVVPRKQLIL